MNVMEEDAERITEAISDGRPIITGSSYRVEPSMEFSDEAEKTIESFQETHDRANEFLSNVVTSDGNIYNSLNTNEEAALKLVRELSAGIEYINENEPEIENGNQYDDGSLNAMYETTAIKARALQHMMGSRETQTQQAQQPQAVAP